MTESIHTSLYTSAQQQAVSDISTAAAQLHKVAVAHKIAPLLLVDHVKRAASDDVAYLKNAMQEAKRGDTYNSGIAQLVLEGVRSTRAESKKINQIAYCAIREALALQNDDFTERYMSSTLPTVHSALQDIVCMLDTLGVIYAQYGKIQLDDLTVICNANLSVKEDVLAFQYADRGGLVTFGNVLFAGISAEPSAISVRHTLEAPPGRDYIRMTVGRSIPDALYSPPSYSRIVSAFRYAYSTIIGNEPADEYDKFDMDTEIQEILDISNSAYGFVRQSYQFATPLFALFNEFVNSVFGLGVLESIVPAKNAVAAYNNKCFTQAQLLRYMQPENGFSEEYNALQTLNSNLKMTLRHTGGV